MITALIILLLFVLHSNKVQILLAFDQMVNAALWGYADESLSARAWRNQYKKRRYAVAVKVINGLFFWQNNHCQEAYMSEKKRRQLPTEYRSE